MLVDIHTNLLWYPDHFSEDFVEASWAAKRAKMRLTPDVHCAVDDASSDPGLASIGWSRLVGRAGTGCGEKDDCG